MSEKERLDLVVRLIEAYNSIGMSREVTPIREKLREQILGLLSESR